MQSPLPPAVPFQVKARYVMYGLVAGLLLGAVIGWVFHKTVGFIITVIVISPFIILAVLAFLYWRRVNAERSAPRGDPLVTEAQWRDVDSQGRSR